MVATRRPKRPNADAGSLSISRYKPDSPWANAQQTQERIDAIDLAEENEQTAPGRRTRNPTLPTLEALADEDSELDDPDNLAPEEGDPLVNMEWWDEISWDQIIEHTAVTMTNVPRGMTLSVGL